MFGVKSICRINDILHLREQNLSCHIIHPLPKIDVNIFYNIKEKTNCVSIKHFVLFQISVDLSDSFNMVFSPDNYESPICQALNLELYSGET